MMLIYGPILMILSLLLGLLSTTANAAPLIRSINPIVPKALHSHLQLRSQGSENSPLPSPHVNGINGINGNARPTSPHVNGINGINGDTRPTYEIWFSRSRPETNEHDPNVSHTIRNEVLSTISQLEHSANERSFHITFLESCPESALGFWYQAIGHDQSHYTDFAPT
ncbi:hypothetical protein F5890DRAFT_863257 [Lentinula detonsa]|uniref:Uncharacterized protein n=1 Tax=Lentinula detonsa TaxID=2804962 RepID=A0AA38Q4A3_9AGAR|nr:hypothetical protein F5890DRAFT_863257 [Lentinula detonsa]